MTRYFAILYNGIAKSPLALLQLGTLAERTTTYAFTQVLITAGY